MSFLNRVIGWVWSKSRVPTLWPLALLSLFLCSGCAVQTAPLSPPTAATALPCLELFTRLDNEVSKEGVAPSRPMRVPGFPYLRSSRFLASFNQQILTPAQQKTWLNHLAQADRTARQIELDSLPIATKAKVAASHGSNLQNAIDDCYPRLVAADLADDKRLALLRQRVQVPSDYRIVSQILGLYPLSAIPITIGVQGYHEETYEVFQRPLAELPILGQLQRWQPQAGVSSVSPEQLPHDPLGIPTPDPALLDTLFARHAPVWEVDVVDENDLLGTPIWVTDGKPSVKPAPAVYRYPSYTRWQTQPLLQLNYVIWFAARPVTGTFDILGGPLDGLIWRVTLNRDGTPLL